LIAVERAWKDWPAGPPCRFINAELPSGWRAAAAALARFVGTRPDALAFVENATQGVNSVFNSLDLRPGGVVVHTDHVYNAVRHSLQHLCLRSGATLRAVHLGLPVASADEMAATIFAAIDGDVRLVVLDHIASASAIIFPVEAVADHCRRLGVPLLIDGAHAPASLTLALDALGADWYVGNCHKWLCAPKGAAFLRAENGNAPPLHPLTISHDYGAGFPAEFFKVGTRDCSAQLAVPAAIAFHERLGGAALRARCHALAVESAAMLAERLGTMTGGPAALFAAMATVALPERLAPDRPTADRLKRRLWDEHRVEIHIMPFAGRLWLRISIAPYNDSDDVERMARALDAVLAGE
jgi:isopenicillin-N epimerase